MGTGVEGRTVRLELSAEFLPDVLRTDSFIPTETDTRLFVQNLENTNPSIITDTEEVIKLLAREFISNGDLPKDSSGNLILNLDNLRSLLFRAAWTGQTVMGYKIGSALRRSAELSHLLAFDPEE